MRFDLRTALQVFAVILFAGLLGLAIATLVVSRGPIPADITGSPVSPERRLPAVSEVLDTGNFSTRAPDGEAHVEIRFNEPAAFRKLSHVYRFDVPEPQRIAVVSLAVSDDGANWSNIGEAEAKGPYGVFAFDLNPAGAHTRWKLTVIKSGDSPDVVFGQLLFAGTASALQRIPIDVPWLGLMPASILILLSFKMRLTSGRLFAATAIPVGLFVFAYSLGYVGIHTVTTFDAAQYLLPIVEGTYSTIRSAGYPTFLLAVSKTVGLDYLAWVQLSVGIACYLAGACLLSNRFGNRWIGPLLVLALLLQGTIVQFAPDVMTETLFTAGLGLFAAALGVLAWRPDRIAVLAAVVGLVLTILTKAVGIVLIVPAILLVRFLPEGRRLAVSGTIVLAGLAAYGLLGVHSYSRSGTASAESFAGYALIGHVGGMLDDAYMPPSDLTRKMINAVAPVIAKRPPDLTDIHSLATLDRYVDVTVRELNPIVWTTLTPIAEQEFGSTKEVNDFFLRFAVSSIRTHPLPYLRHIAAHFYGMWRDLGNILPLREASIFVRREPMLYAYPELVARRKAIPANILSPYPNDAILTGEVARQTNLPLMFGDFWQSRLIPLSTSLVLGGLALFLSILFALPVRLAHVYRTEIMIALVLNAYFGAHVLVQVSTQRYAVVASLAGFFLAASFLCTTLLVLKGLFASATGFLGNKRFLTDSGT